MINKDDNALYRWGIVDGVEKQTQGKLNEGTTIDYGEPFTMTIKCDDDGWMLHVNTELGYPHFFHLFDPLNVTSLEVSGDVLITFVGIGNEGLIIK